MTLKEIEDALRRHASAYDTDAGSTFRCRKLADALKAERERLNKERRALEDELSRRRYPDTTGK